MPDISKQEAVIKGLKNQTHRLLDLSLDSHKVTTGERIPRAGTVPTPTLFAPADLPKDGTYTMLCLDLDAPFGSFNFLSPIVHWLQTDFKVVGQELKSDQTAIAPYLGAGPPPGAAPHRYLFLLYDQKPGQVIPPNWKNKPFSHPQRMRFDVEGMEKLLGLGDVLAANYFVSN